MLIINPGNKVASGGNGWTNTYQQAFLNAEDWLRKMNDNGIRDVSITTGNGPDNYGMWTFTIQHSVSHKCATLDMHGIDNIDAYLEERMFHPRIYWNGSSCSNPELTDFLCEGYEICIREKVTA